ncbi:uncharacterized protein [Parasteatoda tepidariorum]|uniref:uncharacterized protein isoform X3 n=1 Tax=Parasteatoda tepidariorum TaxID=114398 RepID=UPI0039BCBB51
MNLLLQLRHLQHQAINLLLPGNNLLLQQKNLLLLENNLLHQNPLLLKIPLLKNQLQLQKHLQLQQSLPHKEHKYNVQVSQHLHSLRTERRKVDKPDVNHNCT